MKNFKLFNAILFGLFLSMVLFMESNAQTYTGDLTLQSQTEVDAFNYVEVTGNLFITQNTGDITNLNALYTLTTVGGHFTIDYTPLLQNLDGLSSLTSVGGVFNITLATSLTDISGLSSLTSVGSLWWLYCDALTNLDGLSSLTSVGGNLYFEFFPSLTNIDGLSNITSVGGGLGISDAAVLTNLNGLSNVTFVGGGLYLGLMPQLTDYCGLYTLLSGGGLVGSYTVEGNGVNPTQQEIIDGGPCPLPVYNGDLTLQSQTEVDAFNYVEVTGNLFITQNTGDITNLNALYTLTTVGGHFTIDYTPLLQNLDGLSSLTSVGGVFNITLATSLTDISGLSSLTSVGSLWWLYCDALTNLDGLSSLTSVGGNLYFEFFPSLTNIDGLSNITSVGGGLGISDAAVLTNLNGLSNVTFVGGGLYLGLMPQLTDYCGLYTLLSGGGLVGSYTVEGNGVNPTQQEIIDGGACIIDGDGVSTEVEDGAPNEGDGNNDGVQDSEQSNVASLPNAVDSRYVTLVSSGETILTDVNAIENPSPDNSPSGVDFPLGFFDFKVAAIPAGGSSTVTLLLPAGETINTYYKYGPTTENPTEHWYEFLYDGNTGAEILTDEIILHLVDGERGDNDLTANGEIDDPGTPGLAPRGNITGTISVGENVLSDIIVKLLDIDGIPIDDVEDQVTNSLGQYSFDGVSTDTYKIMIVEPLGYITSENPIVTVLSAGQTNIIDFELEEVIVLNDARGKGFWKHQFDVYVRGKGNAQESEENLTAYIAEVHNRYDPRFNIFEAELSFEDWQSVLSIKGNAGMEAKAKSHVAALALNIMSQKIAQYEVVTDDGYTAGDVLTYVSELLLDSDPDNDEMAKDLAEMVNEQQMIEASLVHPSQNILYKQNNVFRDFNKFGVPDQYGLHQNYPNPFNPYTTITFDIPKESHVSLRIYDVNGRMVAQLINTFLRAGHYKTEFNGSDLSSGIYYYELTANEFRRVKKLVLTK